MSIEKLLGDLIDAVNANTEALKAAGGGAASSGKGSKGDDEGNTASTGRGRGRGASNKGDDEGGGKKYTTEQVKAAAVKVKDELGTKAAKDLIKKHGADELAKLEPEAYGAFIADCEKALKEAEEAKAGGDGDDTL
jgi:hypothetical protein